jgi:hypothetical protein
MDQDTVVALMGNSASGEEWNANYDKVKAACNGYPEFWFSAIVDSGLMARTAAKWGGNANIHIHQI